ncbi:MAG: hypothetical protein LW878_06635 [Proteobacteria bacterium]|nr:hypothetical protein [Pseudomonadota bacterium]
MVIKIIFATLLLIFVSETFAQRTSKSELDNKIHKIEVMINQRLKREKAMLDRYLQTKKGRMPKVSKGLQRSYYYLGAFYGQLYGLFPSGEESQEDFKNYTRSKYYLEGAALYEYEIDNVESMLEKLESTRSQRTKLISTRKWRGILQYMSYQELALLKDAAGEEKLYSPQRGMCAGVQWAYGNTFSEWTIDGCVYVASGNVSATNSARYSQDGVNSLGVLLKPTYWRLLSEGEAAIGFGVPVLIRSMDYTNPNTAKVEPRRPVPFGLSVDGRWKVGEKTHLISSMAIMDGSLLWSLGLARDF